MDGKYFEGITGKVGPVLFSFVQSLFNNISILSLLRSLVSARDFPIKPGGGYNETVFFIVQIIV